jgi:hypothetical protein
MIWFTGKRGKNTKRKKGKMESGTFGIANSTIQEINIVDNIDEPCCRCDMFEDKTEYERYMREDAGENIYELVDIGRYGRGIWEFVEGHPCYNCSSEHLPPKHISSFLEIKTQEYIFKVYFPDKDFDFYTDIPKLITQNENFDIDEYINKKCEIRKAEEEREREKRNREIEEQIKKQALYSIKRKLRKREKCPKYCIFANKNGLCNFGYMCEEGIPQEKCYAVRKHDYDWNHAECSLEQIRDFTKED